MARTLQADAAIVPEPSGLGVWVACRGSLLPTITVEGRAGHAGLPQRPAEDGGAVNAIEKMALVSRRSASSAANGNDRPRTRSSRRATACPPSSPAANGSSRTLRLCRLDCHIEYLPGQADEHGWARSSSRSSPTGSSGHGRRSLARRSPPAHRMADRRRPPAEVPLDDPIVTTALAAARAVGRTSELGGLENWHDGATLIVEAGIPSICLGPGDINVAHTIDESVPIVDLVACARRSP